MNTRRFLKLLAMCVAAPFVPKPKPPLVTLQFCGSSIKTSEPYLEFVARYETIRDLKLIKRNWRIK